ncbi:uncharacterized protein LOC134552636 isoform X2 [Prinia subflava]
MEMMRDAKPWKLPPALDKYKSVYRKDYCWHDDYHSPLQAHVPKPSYPAFGDLPKCYLLGCHPSDLSPRWGAGKLEVLAEPMHDLSCCHPPPPAPAAPAAAEAKLVPAPSVLVNYQQLAQDLYLEGLNDADKNKAKAQSSSVLIRDHSDPDWKTIYQQDYKGRRGIFSGIYTGDLRPAPIFPEDRCFNTSRWVTEYGDSYNIFLKRLDWSSPISAQWLPFGKSARWTPRWMEPTH